MFSAIEDIEKTLGDSLRTHRIGMDLTQEDLARNANVSLKAVKNLEAGEGCRLHTYIAVLRALDLLHYIQIPEQSSVLSSLDTGKTLAQRQRVRK